MKRIILISSVSVLTTFHSSYADDLKTSLTKAYDNYPEMKSIQQNYIADIQKYPEAFSESFLPDVSVRSSSASTKAQSGTLAPQDSVRESRGLVVTQNLFAGGSSTMRMASVKHLVDVKKAEYISKEQEFFNKAISVYTELLISKEKLEASKAFVEATLKEFEAANERLKVGEGTNTDVATAKAQHSQALAQNSAYNMEYLVRKSTFENYFGKGSDENISMPEEAENLPSSFDDFRSKALVSNLDLKMIKSQLKAAKNSSRAEHGKLLPRVNAIASQDLNISEAIDSPSSRSKQKSYTTTIQVEIPIFERGGSEYSRIRAAKAAHRKAVYDLDNAERRFESKLIQTWENYNSSKQRVIFSKESAEAYKLAMEGMKSKYDVGMSTIIDYLKSQKDYYDSLVRYIESKEQLIKASYQIKSDLAQLTAKDLGLSVKTFDPEAELRKTKFKIIGF